MKFVIRKLEKRYGRKTVLANVSYTFENGRVYGIYGAKKSGRSTLVDCIRGRLPYKYGSMFIVEDEKCILEAADVGMVHAMPVLPEFVTPYEFVKFFLDIHSDQVKNILPIDTYFDLVNIGMEERYRLIGELPAEIAYIIQLLCFMILPTKIILVEKPKAASEDVMKEMKSLLRKLAHESVVMVFSDEEQIVEFFCDEKAILSEGFLYGPSAYAEEDEDA